MTANEQTELLREMRDLLRVMAEPALAKRDEKLRVSLIEIVGKSKPRSRSVLLMDGSRNQAAIRADSGIDKGELSRLTKALRAAGLVDNDEKQPRLVISIPPNYFEEAKNG